jgi:hypothetical protein
LTSLPNCSFKCFRTGTSISVHQVHALEADGLHYLFAPRQEALRRVYDMRSDREPFVRFCERQPRREGVFLSTDAHRFPSELPQLLPVRIYTAGIPARAA